MRAFTVHTGIVVPLDRVNVDTDLIIPKQFLKSIRRTGFGVNLFDELRYLDQGEPGQNCADRPLNTDFVLNQPRYSKATILLGRANFGCGSSREHAPWALDDFGFRCIIAPSFADIFYNNCFKNGLLPIILPEADVERLFVDVESNEGYRLTVDLNEQTVILPDESALSFSLDHSRKESLLKGLDEIGQTLAESEKIRLFEQKHRMSQPWLFVDR